MRPPGTPIQIGVQTLGVPVQPFVPVREKPTSWLWLDTSTIDALIEICTKSPSPPDTDPVQDGWSVPTLAGVMVVSADSKLVRRASWPNWNQDWHPVRPSS